VDVYGKGFWRVWQHPAKKFNVVWCLDLKFIAFLAAIFKIVKLEGTHHRYTPLVKGIIS
jgi:hypothetical protein